MREVILSLLEAKTLFPEDAYSRMMDRVSYRSRGWTDEVLLPTGAKCYARLVDVIGRGFDIEVKVSGYAQDGSDVDPYDPSY